MYNVLYMYYVLYEVTPSVRIKTYNMDVQGQHL